MSFALYPVAIAIVLGIGLFFGTSTLHNFSLPAFAAAMMPLAITFFVFALFEEVGWRGYLVPKVYGLHGGLLGHLFVGLIWASWHFPYMRTLWAHTAEGMETLLPRFIVGTIISAIVYGEIWLRTGSVWPAVLMHGVGNTLANTLLAGLSNPENADRAGFVTLLPGKEWLSSFGVEGALMMLIFGVVGTV
ncbi:MAG: CPBP family intramembrane metalloprotease, partial [Caldilineaceae bacterium]|nr:CPBP family intramembrane metalloprotease [Caldilineaceae bacterium]